MNKQCNCPSCRGARERNEFRAFVAIMERSFEPAQMPVLEPAPQVRAVKDILGRDES